MVSKAVQVLTKELPNYFKPIIEYQAIMASDGHILDNLDDTKAKIRANNYISTCDEETLSFWERLLNIKYKFGDTIEFRRSRVLQKFNTVVPFSIDFLNNKLTELFGDDYELSVDSETCIINIKVISDRYGAVDLLYDLLWDVLPAHLQVIANQETTNISTCRLNTGGIVSSTFVQNIYHDNVYKSENNINIAGITASISVSNI